MSHDYSPEDELRRYFKLNSYEARAYLALLKSSMKLDALSKSARVPRPRVYDIAESLVSKGFATQRGDTYFAMEPSAALNTRQAEFKSQFSEEERQRVNALARFVSYVGTTPLDSRSTRDPTLLRGLPAISSLLFSIIPPANEIWLMVSKALEAKASLRPIASLVSQDRERKVRVMIPPNSNLDASDRELALAFRAELRESSGFLLDMLVTDKSDVVIGLPDPSLAVGVPVVALYIRDRGFAVSLRESVSRAWSLSKVVKF